MVFLDGISFAKPQRDANVSMPVKQIEDIAEKVLTAAIQVHRTLGPGLMESTYRTCLCTELRLMNLSFEREGWLPLEYRGVRIERAYRIDLLVEKHLVVELKNIDDLRPVHVSQLLTYLRLTGYGLAFSSTSMFQYYTKV